MERIKTLRSDDKMILISIHDPNLAIRYADEIVFMKDGKIFDTLEKKIPSSLKGSVKFIINSSQIILRMIKIQIYLLEI